MAMATVTVTAMGMATAAVTDTASRALPGPLFGFRATRFLLPV